MMFKEKKKTNLIDCIVMNAFDFKLVLNKTSKLCVRDCKCFLELFVNDVLCQKLLKMF